MSEVLERLARTLEARKGADPSASYVAGLYARGLDAILKKVGEEATETVIAAIAQDDTALASEAADLLFHLLLVLAERRVPLAAVLAELERREGTSGLDEKAAREA